MKKQRESQRNFKCIEQQTASGNALRIFLVQFKKYQRKALSYSKRIPYIPHFILRKWANFGQSELELITGHSQLRMVKTSFRFGLVLTTNMNE